jgi:hypothetical protein
VAHRSSRHPGQCASELALRQSYFFLAAGFFGFELEAFLVAALFAPGFAAVCFAAGLEFVLAAAF